MSPGKDLISLQAVSSLPAQKGDQVFSLLAQPTPCQCGWSAAAHIPCEFRGVADSH